jgi:hypothetical protein
MTHPRPVPYYLANLDNNLLEEPFFSVKALQYSYAISQMLLSDHYESGQGMCSRFPTVKVLDSFLDKIITYSLRYLNCCCR